MTRSDRWIGALFFLFGLLVVWQASNLEFASSYGAGSGFFPFWLGLSIVLFAGLILVAALRNGSDAGVVPHFPGKKMAAFLALLIFVLIIEQVGFILAYTGLSIFLLKLEGESWLGAISVSAASGAGFYLFFVRLLSVTLPVGPLGF